MADVTSFTFTPAHSGTTDREFSEITADGKIYCYQGSQEGFSGSNVDKNGNPIENRTPKYLLQLIDDTHIKVESQIGACSANEKFSNPVIYER